MQVTNEIRQAFLLAVPPASIEKFISIAFEATETEQLMKWLTLHEKVKFGTKLLDLCPNFEGTLDLSGEGPKPHPTADEWCICLDYLAGTPHDCKGPKYEPDPRD